MSTRPRGVLLLLALAACSTAEGQPTPVRTASGPAAAAAAAAPDLGPRTLDDLALLATGRPLDPATLQATSDALRSGTKTLDQFIDGLVHTPEFGKVIVPRVLLGEIDLGPVNFNLRPLQSKPVAGQTVYYLRKPCELAESEEVVPWWDRTKKLRICTADYQPDNLRSKDGLSCSSVLAMEKPECGCGKNLINCVRDRAQNREIYESLYQESIGIIAKTVDSDAPFKDVFTTVYSLRDRTAEYMRLRDKLYAGLIKEIPDLASWDKPVWAPREEFWPGSQSGILTATQYLYMSCGPRDRMRLVFARTWCTTPGSFGVTSEQFSKLVGEHKDIRFLGEGWQGLAASPGCTDCHARMDYGMQFFAGYPAVTKAVGPVPAQSRHAERGPIYMRDIEDPRGEAALTPHALGELIVAQPEFGECMVKRVSDHVLGMTATVEDRKALLDVFTKTGQMRPLYLAALQRYATRSIGAPARAIPPVKTTRPSDVVAISPELAAKLVDRCGDCHEEGRHAFLAQIKTKPSLPRETMLMAANFVASGLMPKDQDLSVAEKIDILEPMIEHLAPDEKWAKNAREYWLGGFAGSRAHHIAAVRERIALESGYTLTPADRGHTVEDVLEGDLETLTPAFVSQVGQLALTACKSLAGKPGYRDCLRKALRPDALLVGRP